MMELSTTVGEIILDYEQGESSHQGLEKKKAEEIDKSRGCRREGAETGKGAMSHNMPTASRIWKRQGTEFPWNLQRDQPCRYLDWSHARVCLGC